MTPCGPRIAAPSETKDRAIIVKEPFGNPLRRVRLASDIGSAETTQHVNNLGCDRFVTHPQTVGHTADIIDQRTKTLLGKQPCISNTAPVYTALLRSTTRPVCRRDRKRSRHMGGNGFLMASWGRRGRRISVSFATAGRTWSASSWLVNRASRC